MFYVSLYAVGLLCFAFVYVANVLYVFVFVLVAFSLFYVVCEQALNIHKIVCFRKGYNIII